MSDNKETFHYTYSSAQQEEIEAIRKKYTAAVMPAQLDKMEQLRRLDAGVTNRASMAALCVGILSALVLGLGMSLIMTDLGARIGLSGTIVPGILIGVVGMLGVMCAYPVYQHVLKRERKRVAPQVLKLTEELSR